MSHLAIVIPGIDHLAGAERQAILLATGFAERGWRVTVIALSGTGGEAGRALTAAGVDFLTLEMRKGLADPRGWARLHRWVRSNRPDIVHAHLPHGAWMVRLSRLFAPERVALDTIHSAEPGGSMRRRIYGLTGWLPDRVTMVSTDALLTHETAHMVSPNRAMIVPNGIDTDEWRPDCTTRAKVRSEIGVADGFLWLAAGRLEPVKDYPSLLHAFVNLPGTARLAIAGSGCMERVLRSLAERLGIESRVHFLGFRNDMRRIMQAADAFVLSSLCEGLPMCLLEAGACGLPSVVTEVPGTREIVVDGETGYLAMPGRPYSLCSAMARMMQMSPEKRCAMGMKARQRIVENYRLNRVLDQWEGLYRDLLERNPHPRRWSGSV